MTATAYAFSRPTIGGRRLAVEDLWEELGAAMRALRTAAGMSLRGAEVGTQRGRGMLSQIETGKARPPRDVVEWYDEQFGGDHVLISMFAEARGAHGPEGVGRSPASAVPVGDAVLIEAALASGLRVRPGASVVASWTLHNTGTVAWTGRSLRRVGATVAPRLLASPAVVPVPATAPGASVTVDLPVEVPSIAGTFAAYWEVVDDRGRRCFGRDELLSVLVVADW